MAGCAAQIDADPASRMGHQADGSYVATDEDKRLSCMLLGEKMKSIATSMTTQFNQAKNEHGQTPKTVAQMYGRMTGRPGDGTPYIERYRRDLGQVTALRELAKVRSCTLPDADKQVAEVQSKMDAFRGPN